MGRTCAVGQLQVVDGAVAHQPVRRPVCHIGVHPRTELRKGLGEHPLVLGQQPLGEQTNEHVLSLVVDGCNWPGPGHFVDEGHELAVVARGGDSGFVHFCGD